MTFSHALAALWPKPKRICKAFLKLIIPFFVSLYLYFYSSLSFAQPRQDGEAGVKGPFSQTYAIGQQLPDEFWEQLHRLYLGEKLETITLESFKGKALILDFWATWCTSCLKAMPKIDSIASRFEGALAVLPVTSESAPKVAAFMNRNDLFTRLELPTLIADSILARQFPHQFIPHYVWIDARGYVRGITSSDDINTQNITSLLSETESTFGSIPIDYTHPVFVGKGGGYGSFFSDTIQGDIAYLNKTRRSKSGKIYSRLFLNVTLETLVSNIAKEAFKANQLPHAAFPIIWDQLMKERQQKFTYEIVLPEHERMPIGKYMLEDLNRFSPYRFSIEKRSVDCLVLTRIPKSENFDKALSSSGKQTDRSLLEQGYGKLTNQAVSILLQAVRGHHDAESFLLDDTGIEGKIDITLDLTQNLKGINKQLAKYGMQLNPETRRLDAFVVKAKADQGFGQIQSSEPIVSP